MSVDIALSECRNFWCAMGELRQALADGTDPAAVEFHLDELEALHMHTELPVLRRRCAAVLALHRPSLQITG